MCFPAQIFVRSFAIWFELFCLTVIWNQLVVVIYLLEKYLTQHVLSTCNGQRVLFVLDLP